MREINNYDVKGFDIISILYLHRYCTILNVVGAGSLTIIANNLQFHKPAPAHTKVSKIEDLSQSIWLNLARKTQHQHRKSLGDRK